MDRRDDLSTYLERFGPYAGGVATLCLGLLWHGKFETWFVASGMNGKDAVGAVFNVMVTLTAFLFSVFVIAIAPGGGFIEKIFSTDTFRIFKRYVVEALLVGGIAALISVPFMSTSLGQGVWNGFLFQVGWATVNITSILAFLRVIHIFVVWIGYDAQARAARRKRIPNS